MKWSFVTNGLVLASLAASCGQARDPSTTKFDAEHSVAVDGTVDAGLMVSYTNDPGTLDAEIRAQLMYTIGIFNGFGGTPDMAKTSVAVQSVTPRADGSFVIRYAAHLFVSWPREVPLPPQLTLTLPSGGDAPILTQFYAAFGSDELGAKLCMDPQAHEVSQGIFWYYYRPNQSSCSLSSAATMNRSLALQAGIRLVVSGENTHDKFPEYGKVWADGKLVATLIFAKYTAGAADNGDPGIDAYRSTYADLLRQFGAPQATSLPAGLTPDAAHPDVALVFGTANGPLDVELFLVDAIRSTDGAFQQKYNERTQTSDFVSYSGHSGLGANIQALARLGHFVRGQYQIFLVNGCDTFAYIDSALADAHQAVNPGAGPDKYFDIITNAMPSYFSNMASSNMAVINALVGKQKTYRQLLADFDISQRPAVTGEEDNRWPLPFDP